MNWRSYLRNLALSFGLLLVFAPLAAQVLSCQDIDWHPDALARFPDVEAGCQEVIIRDGQPLARFEARLVRARSNGEVTIRLLLNDGTYVSRTFHAPRDFKVSTAAGSKMRIFDLERGETLDIFISGNNFSLTRENASAPAERSVAKHMHEHLSRISALKAFIIAGQLEDLREPAMWLAEHEAAPGLPGDWAPYVEELRHYARQVASAKHLGIAAASVSEMARTCGDCHQANGFDVAFGYDERPPEDVHNIMADMQRHLWAADRMWEGLIGPSDVAWDRATDILAEVTLRPSDITKTADQEAPVKNLLTRARELGEECGRAISPESRSALYGELLSLCASCHSLTGGGPAS